MQGMKKYCRNYQILVSTNNSCMINESKLKLSKHAVNAIKEAREDIMKKRVYGSKQISDELNL